MSTFYSQEFLFKQKKKNGNDFKIRFKKGTESSKIADSIAVFDIKLSDRKLLDFLENMTSVPPINTYGTIKSVPYFNDSMDDQQRLYFENHGFSTDEIAEIIILEDKKEQYKPKPETPPVTLKFN